MSYFRPTVDQMHAYVPGEQPPAGSKIVKLNTNENPYPPSPQVYEAIQAELAHGGELLRRYSDPAALRLRQAAAKLYGFSVGQVLHGNGSDELLALLFRSLVDPGETVLYPYPTYTLYETLAHSAAAKIETIDFDASFRLPEALFGSSAKLVLVANPNAPSGNAHPILELERLANSLKGGVLVIDEAYADFASDNALALVHRCPNVVVLRTFSKSHSLAGMRIGLLFGSEVMLTGISKVKDSYNLDRLAIAAGAAALDDNAWAQKNVARVLASRDRVAKALRDFGLEVLPSETNFLLVRLASGAEAKRVYLELKERGVLVRYFSARLLEDALRISIGTDAECDVFLRELAACLPAR